MQYVFNTTITFQRSTRAVLAEEELLEIGRLELYRKDIELRVQANALMDRTNALLLQLVEKLL